MNVICSPKGIMGIKRSGQGILDITKAGFNELLLDISMFCSAGELEDLGKKRKKDGAPDTREELIRNCEAFLCGQTEGLALDGSMKILLERFQEAHFQIPVARTPYLLRNTRREDLNGLLERLAWESIVACGKMGIRYLIIRPLFSGINKAKLWEANRESYLALAHTAKENDVMILLENQCQDMNGRLMRGICAEAEEAVSWVDELNAEVGEERFGFCMDVGACNLCGQNMRDFAVSLGSRIKAVILRDCDGYKEASLLPFTCSGFERSGADWLGLIRGLREIGFDGQLIMDFSTTAAFFSPLLRPQLMQLAKGTAEYFKWQIGIENLLRKYPVRVLFGAGNMCRNYMKCYGEKYSPLYTCDNDRKIWETEFCGLMVRPPEALLELSEDCAIFICNIYYREIEEQLRKMGIRNPIEYFSDEYMPSFYFDRLERK